MNEFPRRARGAPDELELLDAVQAAWRWRYLILVVTLAFAALAAAYTYLRPEVYRISMVLRPGLLRVGAEGENIYVDTPQNIKGMIEAGTFRHEILTRIRSTHHDSRLRLGRIRITIPEDSNVMRISYDSSDIALGVDILNHLKELLLLKYADLVKYYRDDYETRIRLRARAIEKLNNRISKIENEMLAVKAEKKSKEKQILNEIVTIRAEKETRKKQIENMEKTISAIELEMKRIAANTNLLIDERDRFMSSRKSGDNVLSAVIYSNTIQQNIGYLNELRDSTSSRHNRIYSDRLEIEKAESRIQDLMTQLENMKEKAKYEIEDLEAQIKDLENEARNISSEIANLEFRKNKVENVRVLQGPTGEQHPVNARPLVYVLLLAGLGLFVSVLLAFFLEYLGKHAGVREERSLG